LNKNFPGAVSDARAGFAFGGAGETSRRCLMAALAWQAISGWGAGRMSGHGTLVPIPNGWRVFWRGLDWERYPGLSPGTISGCAGRYSGRRPERYSRAGARERGGARDFSPDSQWVAGVLAGEELGNDIPGFRPGRYPAAPDDIQAWRPERYSRAGARERRGHVNSFFCRREEEEG